MKRIAIDASIALKWYFNDEEGGDEALGILEAHAGGRIALIAPSLLEYEMASGLAIARRRGRLAPDEAIKAMDGFTGLGIELYELGHLYAKALRLCETFGISAYDAAYLALAEEMKIQLVTADEKLLNSTQKLKFLRPLREFRA